jgi:hypothetical protein
MTHIEKTKKKEKGIENIMKAGGGGGGGGYKLRDRRKKIKGKWQI